MVLDIDLFNNFRITIFIYYFLTVTLFLGLSFYFLRIVNVENIAILGIVSLCFIIISAIFVSKLAVDPLLEYVKNLQDLSTETLHELNLPVSTIMTNTQMLEKSLDDEKSKKRLSRIKAACGMLQESYNELDYMIKKQSKESLQEFFSLDELIEERVAFVSKIYPFVEWNLFLDQMNILSDRKGLSKVIDNLIDNGVKYSKNSKTIDIYIEQDSLKIKDYGIGMDEVELVHVFDSYYQTNSQIQGFGIGLSMVKRFCDNNGVTLSIHSTKDIGTTVELKFKN